MRPVQLPALAASLSVRLPLLAGVRVMAWQSGVRKQISCASSRSDTLKKGDE
jgi:hypothetical protein